MEDLFDYEMRKYDLVMGHHGIAENQLGFGRQINMLRNDTSEFCRFWREYVSKKNSFLEIGIGAAETLRFFRSEDLHYCGVDISKQIVDESIAIGLNAKHMSANELSFDDSSFDIVQHLDGMEHIPIQWEKECLSEAVRVAKTSVMYANAMGDAYLDAMAVQHGFDGVHVNIKNEDEWIEFYKTNSIEMGYSILLHEVTNGTFYICLSKNAI